MVDHYAIPDTLQATDQWVCWRSEYRDGNPTKVPIDPAGNGYAKTSDPDTWTGFDTAYTHYRLSPGVDGVGFVFTDDDPYIGVDLDDCRDPDTGSLDDRSIDVIRTLDSYTEASPSGTGVHVIVTGEKPAGRCRRDGIELYDRDRYFTVTGAHLDLTPQTVNQRTDAVATVHETYLERDDPAADGDSPAPPADSPDLDDDELIEKAMNADNGDKFQQLWNGDTSGYPSHSEADQALCNMLAFWTGGDHQRVERLFEQSGLVRDKWREREDYRERTISRAIRNCPEYYSP